MKHIIKPALLLLCAVGLLTACDDDNDANPTLQVPSTFTLNTPGVSANNVIDLAHSDSINLTCSQPDYGGFPAETQYTVEVATKADMSDAVTLSQTFKTTRIALDAAEVASTLTNLELNDGKTEADFPMEIPAYFRATAVLMNTATKLTIDDTKVVSNVVSLNHVNLPYSLPPVTAPETLYITGSFCGWDWGNAVQMVEVNGTRDAQNSTVKLWHMVWLDASGIKFNTTPEWNGSETGFAGITVDAASELGSQIQDSGDGNIATSTPGWYLMVVTATVNGRNIDYTVTFNEPKVYLMGIGLSALGVASSSYWDEATAMGVSAFTVPTAADGEFVSPELPLLPGNDDGGCVRVWVKVPGYDWWKSELIVGLDADGKISYRGNGGDQDRVGSSAGQRVHLNFSNDTGSIK